MSSLACGRPLSLVALILLAGTGWPQLRKPPQPQMAILPDYVQAQRQAKTSGLPMLVMLLGKDNKQPAAISDPLVIESSAPFLNVLVPAASPVMKKLEGATAGGALILDGDGKTLALVDPGYTAASLVEKLQQAAEETRAKLRDKLQNAKTTAAGQRAAIDSYIRLGAAISDLIPLLAHKQADVKTAVRTTLVAREKQGADWFVLNAMVRMTLSCGSPVIPWPWP